MKSWAWVKWSDKELYMKYRPKTLDEVVGQEDAVRQTKEILACDGWPSGWWISGTGKYNSGHGKTTLARLIAGHG